MVMEPPPKDGGQVRQAPGLTRRRTRPQAGPRACAHEPARAVAAEECKKCSPRVRA